MVDNQHHELNNIESKLEENLEATLKNLSHNNVHTVQTTVPLHDDDVEDRQQLVAAATGGSLEDQRNDTVEAAKEISTVPIEENEQPLLVMVPTKEPDSAPTGSISQSGESSSTQEASTEAIQGSEAGTTVVPPKQLEVNLTEENPMPVFSEWAQKQMAEAEKKLGEVVNASAMKKAMKPAGSKTGGGAMKLRAKNYAAPECGAKIIASNPEAQSTSSVLTAHKDEYLLNPCTSKIWFVVELCEPVQAERIELANFELFSSSPKEFTVSVSNRFPTRDWANVGQFTAKDERDVQSFQLHPHLFGKFVRVEILSHYNQEHFCPVSLFRVYGTSEFEAFETDNTPLLPDDDDDDDEMLGLGNEVESKDLLQTGNLGVNDGEGVLDEENQPALQGGKLHEEGVWEKLGHDGTVGRKGGKNPNNILKSAGEVVMNMVKKAAEALGKSGNDSNDSSIGGSTTEGRPSEGRISVTSVPTSLPASSSLSCVSLAYTIRCVNCTDHFRARLESLMNCKHNLLTSLLGVARIERSFDSAQHFLCANVLGFNLPRSLQGDGLRTGEPVSPMVCMNMRYSVLNLLPDELVAGLCNMVAFDLKLISKSHPDGMQEKKAIEGSEAKVHDNDKISLEYARGDDGAKNLANQQHEEHASAAGKLTIDINHIPKTIEQGDTSEQHGQDTEKEDKEQASTVDANDQAMPETGSKEDVNMFNIATEPSVSTTPEPVRDDASQATDRSKEQEHQQQENREKEDFTNSQHWEAIDDSMLGVGGHHPSEVAGTGPSGSGSFTTGPAATTAPSGMASGQQKVQPESVFLRLSNRIKALERNMSLSGQYLEELSRRYRKQVEELQHSYAKTLHEIQEQNLRMADSEMKLREVNERLRQDLVEFQATATDWRNIALAVLVFIVVMLFILLASVRSIGNSVSRLEKGRTVDKQQQPAPLPQSVIDRELAQVGSDAKPIRGRMLRRKSIDGMPMGGAVDVTGSTVSSASGIIIATGESSTVATSMSPARLRKKRPSEEALNISGTYVNLLIDDGEGCQPALAHPVALERKKSKHKHRKVSAPSMVANSSITMSHGSGYSHHELARRSVSMIEPQEQQRWKMAPVNGGSERQQTPEKEHSGRIDELPYLEDNDEFIIPTASDLSYDEYVPGSNPSSMDAGLTQNDMERTVNGTPDRNGSVPPQLLTSGGDTADGMEPKANLSKAGRRLQEAGSSPDGKQQQQRQRVGKAKSASPSDGGSKQIEQEPVKLSVSFNGDLPSNGVATSGNLDALERKSSRGSIRRLFRKMF
uniref:SUN domain-containing protein n=1 Tax=Anopheles culicifacies TaxID=139723 RepID=A0A182MPA1_9DIPT